MNIAMPGAIKLDLGSFMSLSILVVGAGGSGGEIYTGALVVNLAEEIPDVYKIDLRPPESLFTQ
jgi:hypothetical protein